MATETTPIVLVTEEGQYTVLENERSDYVRTKVKSTMSTNNNTITHDQMTVLKVVNQAINLKEVADYCLIDNNDLLVSLLVQIGHIDHGLFKNLVYGILQNKQISDQVVKMLISHCDNFNFGLIKKPLNFVDCFDRTGNTVLMWACKNGKFPLIKKILPKVSNEYILHKNCLGYDSIMMLYNGNRPISNKLWATILRRFPNQAVDTAGNNGFMYAYIMETSLQKYAIQNFTHEEIGLDWRDISGNSCFMTVCYTSRSVGDLESFMDKYLDHVDVTVTNTNGNSCFWNIVSNIVYHKNMIKFNKIGIQLLEMEAPISNGNDHYNEVLGVCKIKGANSIILKLLALYPEQFECQSHNGETPLILCLKNNNVIAAKRIISVLGYSCNPGATDAVTHETAIILACKMGHKQVALTLLNRFGLDSNPLVAESNGFDCFYYCNHNGLKEVARLIMALKQGLEGHDSQ